MKTKRLIIITILTVMYSLEMNSQNDYPQNINDAKTAIIGEWVNSENNSYKIVFTSTMEQKIYISGVLQTTYAYEINNVCNSNQIPYPNENRFMLITKTSNNEVLSCDIIQSLDSTVNQEVLSITTEGQGKSILYERP